MEMILENLPMALCVLLGMGLILVEVFLPGFGLPGISGIALVGVGTIMAAMHFGTLTAVALLLVIIAVLAVLVSWLLRSAAKGDVAKSKLFLHQKEELPMRLGSTRRGLRSSITAPDRSPWPRWRTVRRTVGLGPPFCTASDEAPWF